MGRNCSRDASRIPDELAPAANECEGRLAATPLQERWRIDLIPNCDWLAARTVIGHDDIDGAQGVITRCLDIHLHGTDEVHERRLAIDGYAGAVHRGRETLAAVPTAARGVREICAFDND